MLMVHCAAHVKKQQTNLFFILVGLGMFSACYHFVGDEAEDTVRQAKCLMGHPHQVQERCVIIVVIQAMSWQHLEMHNTLAQRILLHSQI